MKWSTGLALLCALASSSAERSLEFNRDVRPILSDKCFLCHGPDAAAKNVPRRLDLESDAKADRGGRRAIVEHDPSSSELIRRITARDAGQRMPPAVTGLRLTAAEIETLAAWIAQGARWQKHWSFLPPVRPARPLVKNAAWARNPIDGFILERLEREGLRPSPEARRETVLRRVSLDLTGLPPTPAEQAAFLEDRSANALEKVVDRLLASPRYGERMAVRWLEAARYADTNGYQYDGERVMWRWRDWVIDAFNRNQPYDRFALEQIAGDMLPGATREQRIATGFNRNHRGNTEDGLIPEEYAVEYVVDRVETTSTVFLGLTIGCARCHNHKYDPVSQKEFYQLFAYFNNVPERGRAMKYGNSPPVVEAPTLEQQERLSAIEVRIRRQENYLERHAVPIARAQGGWERRLAQMDPVWWMPPAGLAGAWPFEKNGELKTNGSPVALEPGRIGRAASFRGESHFDLGNMAGFDIEDRFTLAAWVRADGTPDGPILTRMADNPRGKGYGLHLDGGRVHAHLTSVWVDDAIRVETEQTLEAGRWYHLAATYDGSRMAEGIALHIDGRPANVRILMDTLYRPFRNAGRAVPDPFRIGGGWGPKRRYRGLIDEARVYDRVLSAEEIQTMARAEPLHAIAAKPAAAREPLDSGALRRYFLEREAAPEIRSAWEQLSALRLEKERFARTFPTVMVMAERPTPGQTHVLIRGAYDKPGETVEPGVPSVFPPLPSTAANNRLGFAQWLTGPGNPLFARVAVNRLWQMLFGTGLVKTTEDLGGQGEWPSHPELLDWLATEFVRGGYDVKALLKLMVTSATYRQSSRASPELLRKDPENRLLARGPRFRLPAEMIRDQALWAAGLLAERIGGPSVMPYQPAGLWKEITMQDTEYRQSRGPDLYRRGLYTYWKRTAAPPMLMNFDAAARENCVVRDTRTNTPIQALNLMNDVTFVEAARFLGQRMIREGGDGRDQRLRHGFRLALARAPSAAEMEVLRGSLQYHLDYFASQRGTAQAFLRHGDAPPDPALEARELAAYASVAGLILNLDEAVTKE